MEYVPCNLILQKIWPETLSLYHLRTDNIKWSTRYGRECESPVIISLFEKQRTSSRPGLFAVVHLDNCPKTTAGHVSVDVDNYQAIFNHSIDFHCSKEFLEHYGLENSLDEISFACVTAFPLKQVVIAAETDEVFQWTKEQKFETGLVVSSSGYSRSLLVRCGDIFLSPPIPAFGFHQADLLKKFQQLKVIKCSPLEQGILSINTSVIVVKSDEPSISTKPINGSLLNKVAIHLYDFCPSNSREDSSTATEFGNNFSKIFASETAARNLNLKDKDYVLLQVKPRELLRLNENETNLYQRPFVFGVIPKSFNGNKKDLLNETKSLNRGDVFRIPTTSWFNMIGESEIRRFNPTRCTFQIEKLEKSSLEYAKEIHLSLILSPNYSPSGCFDKSLVKFFITPQIVKVGNVIAVNVEDDYDYYEATDVHYHRCRFLYYKVTKLNPGIDENSYYLVDTAHTTLYQDGTTNSFIPVLQSTQRIQSESLLPGLSKYVEDMVKIVTPYLAEHGQFDHSCSLLLSGQIGCGKRSIIGAVCKVCNIHLVEIECQSLLSDTSGASEAKINEAFRRASLYSPCAVLLTNIDSVGMNRETNRIDNRVSSALCKAIDSLPRRSGKTMPAIVIATTYDTNEIVADVRMQFLHQIVVESPSESDRLEMLLHASKHHDFAAGVDYHWLAKHTAGFVYGDIWEMLRKTTQITYARTIDECAVGSKLSWNEEECVAMAGITLSYDDVTKALQQMQSDRADTIGVPKIPDIDWRDIGGLEEVKSHILDTIQLPQDHPELVSTGLRRSGVLLYGPPGTGKTLLAKAVASQCSLSFLSVKGPELINMYVGQSEANVRRVFQRARDAAPCVVFFDELDALAPNRGRSGDSGGVMDRVVSQLLAELDGVNSGDNVDKQVFIIAASNRPDLIDQALLRPGRLDKLLYVGICENKLDRLKVLHAQTRKMNLSPRVNLEEVVEACPANMTGADFYGLTTEAALNAVRRRILEIEDGQIFSNLRDQCAIEQDDFLNAASRIVPSLTASQLDNYKRVKAVMIR